MVVDVDVDEAIWSMVRLLKSVKDVFPAVLGDVHTFRVQHDEAVEECQSHRNFESIAAPDRT